MHLHIHQGSFTSFYPKYSVVQPHSHPSATQLYSCYDQLINDCSYRVNLNYFCNCLWLLASKAESRTSRVRFQCGRPSHHLLITHPHLPCVQGPALSVIKHSVSSALVEETALRRSSTVGPRFTPNHSNVCFCSHLLILFPVTYWHQSNRCNIEMCLSN